MRRLCTTVLVGLLGGLLGCAGQGRWVEGRGEEILNRELKQETTAELQIVNSALVVHEDGKYRSAWDRWKSGAPPYRLELIAPAAWVDKQKRQLALALVPQEERMSPEFLPQRAYRPQWFVPGAIQDYEVWRGYLPSYPYQMMYIDKRTREGARVHLYLTMK